VVQEVEDQRVKHLERRGTDGATRPARLVRAAVEGRGAGGAKNRDADDAVGASAAIAAWAMAGTSNAIIRNQCRHGAWHARARR
jgi:hypothetical protein